MMRPPFSVMQATTPHLSFAEDLELYRSADVSGIGLAPNKLAYDQHDLELLDASGLTVSTAFLQGSSILPRSGGPAAATWMHGPEDPEARIELLIAGVQRVAPYKPEACVVVTGPSGKHEPARARAIVVDGLRRLAGAAADLGLSLALEVMHPSLCDTMTFVNTIADGAELLDEVDAPNVAIVADVWHLVPGPELLGEIRTYADRLSAFHVNDRPRKPRSIYDRTLPGDGVNDFAALLGSLEAGGFRGWIELEILSDDGTFEQDFEDSLWKWDPGELITTARDRYHAAWEERKVEA